MKATEQCPKCSQRLLYVITPRAASEVRHRRRLPLPVVTLNIQDARGVVQAGRHELWICATCGFEEWYAFEVNQMLETLLSAPEAA